MPCCRTARGKTLLRIPDWNFDWQQQYTYAAPLRLPAGSRVEMEFTYDNSAENPRNPHHPPQRVTWGPGSADEMAGPASGGRAGRRGRCRGAVAGALGQNDAAASGNRPQPSTGNAPAIHNES